MTSSMARFITNRLKRIYRLPKLNYPVTVKTCIYIQIRALFMIIMKTYEMGTHITVENHFNCREQ